MPSTYVESLRRAGAVPIVFVPPEDEPEELLALVDGLLLMGGGDVEPSRYGAASHDEVYGVEPERDELEISLLRIAARDDVPTLAVCRGIQVMNVAFGGTLHPHLPDVEELGSHGPPLGDEYVRHAVKLSSASRIAEAAGADVLACSSHHHQGVDRIGDGLVAAGWSEDGLVEAIERERGWMLGLQWHPEETAAEDGAQQGLFDALVERARR